MCTDEHSDLQPYIDSVHTLVTELAAQAAIPAHLITPLDSHYLEALMPRATARTHLTHSEP